MKKLIIFIVFALFSIPGFGASPGIIDCRDTARNIIAYERPGSRNVVEVLKCDQRVTPFHQVCVGVGKDVQWRHVQDYCDDVIIALNDLMGIDLTRKYLQLADVRKIMGATKKDAV